MGLKEILEDGKVIEDEIRQFFFKDLNMARKVRPFLITMEIDFPNNPDKHLSNE